MSDEHPIEIAELGPRGPIHPFWWAFLGAFFSFGAHVSVPMAIFGGWEVILVGAAFLGVILGLCDRAALVGAALPLPFVLFIPPFVLFMPPWWVGFAVFYVVVIALYAVTSGLVRAVRARRASAIADPSD